MTLIAVGLLVKSADWQVEVLTFALLVAGAGSGLVELSLCAFKIALVVIGDSIFTANELGVTGTVTAVLEVVRRALALVEESLSLASKDALILEGFHISRADWLGNGGATAGTEASGLRSDAYTGADGDALVLIGDVVSSANGLERVITGTGGSNGGSDVVSGSASS